MNENGLGAADVPEEMWREMRREYLQNEGRGYRAIAKAYGVKLTTIKARAKREEWPRLRAEYQETGLRKQKAALLRAQLDDAEEMANCRVRYAQLSVRLAKRIAELANTAVNADIVAKLASALHRCQEIEFRARGIEALTGSETHHHHYGNWNEWLEAERERKGLPNRPSPFRGDD